MKNELYIGEVSRLLNISKDTLRYFDKEGIVIAKKGENNYRYYDDWDINYLIEYKKYREFGFNVNQTKEILYNDSLNSLKEKMKMNQLNIEKKIQYYQLILDKNKKYILHLENIQEKINQYKITDMVQIYYFPIRYNNAYLCKPDVSYMMSRWLDDLPIVDPIMMIENPKSNNYECGISITKEYQEKMQLPFNHLIKQTHQSKAINTIIIAGDKNSFSTELLNPVYQYIQQQGYIINGTIIGYYLARVHEKNGYQRYIDLYVPIK